MKKQELKIERSALYIAEISKVKAATKARIEEVNANADKAIETVNQVYPQYVNMTDQQFIEYINGQFLSQYNSPADCNRQIKCIDSPRYAACLKMVKILQANFNVQEIQKIIDSGLLAPYFSFQL